MFDVEEDEEATEDQGEGDFLSTAVLVERDEENESVTNDFEEYACE